MSSLNLPKLPPNAPPVNSRFWPAVARGILRLSGWRLHGELPDLPKLIVIGAPHSSYWDGFWGLVMKIAAGVNIGIMIKREVVEGPLGVILRPIGMIPINRGAATDVVGQMVERFAAHEKMWLGITPEGTRKPVKRWKSGFMRIAQDAQVPILPLFIDYPSKSFTLGTPFYTTGDADADMAAIQAQFAPYKGKYRTAALVK
ncbi:1-acyl-sn-glycerol-3-phosphate acyltransferase [Dyella sp. GSA-30]|uniref:1-acyl-sn-glycerol-3-phosphate acyltransferase n=1 Tax=Dyella sp. GSA-30 TaxID=2994496 RepID=UPI00249352D3|nr:1-acyl-sn-glycerol-3-phosphate acyltransferase [Dyella sp. GSA-30]BDU18865.1 acyltransferase [Dyella sp. GSA-30]